MNNEELFGHTGVSYGLDQPKPIKATRIDILDDLSWELLRDNVYSSRHNGLSYIRIAQGIAFYVCVDSSFILYFEDLLKDYSIVMKSHNCYRISQVQTKKGPMETSYRITKDVIPCVQIENKCMPLLTYICLSLYGFNCTYVPSNGSWRDCRKANMVCICYGSKIYYKLTCTYRKKSIVWKNHIKDNQLTCSIKGLNLIESWLGFIDFVKRNHYDLCYYNTELIE